MPGGNRRDMPSSITRLTALDHDRMCRLLRRACRPGPSQGRWRDELVSLVRAYLSAVRSTLSQEVAGAASSAGLGRLGRVGDDLDEAARAAAEAPATGARLAEAVTRMDRVREQHAALLRDEVLGPLESVTPRREMRRLGGVYAHHRDAALRDEGAVDPPPRRLDLSRAELYELAKKAGIEGRSAMSRRDLIVELQRRQQPR